MPLVTLTFQHELNVSVQIGDIAYYINTNPVGPNKEWASSTTPHHTGPQSGIIKIGPIVGLTQGVPSNIVCDIPLSILATHGLPGLNDFIMFSKDNKANLSSLLGYYAKVKFVNNSTDEAELFSVGTNIFESSK
jgi:hypothetical protein